MTRKFVLAVAALPAAILLASGALAQKPAGAAPVQASDPNERICKDIYLGSRVTKKRYCGTRAEWEERERQDRAEMQNAQRPMQCTAVMGGRKC